MNIYLIGYRCTGKTTVGMALADRLGWPFVDTDRRIVEAGGSDIARMVDEKGWPFFRQQERAALRSVAATDRQVVATGGGMVLDDRNVALMDDTGRIVWLTAGAQTIQERMREDETTAGNRPSLTDQGLMAEIGSVLAERTPLYDRAADLTIDTQGATITAICEDLERRLELGNQPR